MTTTTPDRARLEELLGEYWEIAFEESSGVVATGNKANRVLHEIRALFYALAAPATAPDEQIRKDAERYRWCVKNNLVLAGGTREFGWQIAPVGSEWNRYIDSAMKGTP